RRLEPEGRCCHPAGDGECTPCRRRRLAENRELRDRRPADLVALLFDPVARTDGATAQPPLDEVDAPTLEPRIRSAKEREQLGALAAEPREAQHREKRGAERR